MRIFISATESGSNTSFQPAALTQLDVMAGLVIGFYFGRTNHQRMVCERCQATMIHANQFPK